MRTRWLGRAAAGLRAGSSATLIDCSHGVRLLGLHTPAPGRPRGLAVFLHGWEGCADSHYILSAARLLSTAGFQIFRLNFRDHGGTHGLNPELFHSCRIEEVIDAVRKLRHRHPDLPTFLIGYSLGGNFALRVAAGAGSELELEKVIAICPVLSPHSTMHALERGPWVYRAYYLNRWRRSLKAKAAAFPGLYDFGDLRRLPTLTATTEFFLDRFTDFPDLDTYLHGYAITGSVLAGLAVPARLLAAADDPVIPVRDLDDLASSDRLAITVTRHGGHCAFLEDFALRSWLDRTVLAELERG
jgi:uncharacterized protein